MREVIATGNVLIAKAAIDCGCKFFGGYPITPSSEIAHELSHLLPAMMELLFKWKMKFRV